MKPIYRGTLLFLALWLRCAADVSGQADTLRSLLRQFDYYRHRALQEKVFVHADRSFYLTGETLWFKVYCVDGTFHRPLDLSKVAYLEVMDRDRKPVLQTKITLEKGSGSGALTLPTSLLSGQYRVRSYTHWMKNFGPDYFFETVVTVVNPSRRLGPSPPPDSLDYDVQFFPEGGNLVRDVPGKVAFRGTDPRGRGIDFRGVILDETNDTVARFKPRRFGIGHFTFTPAGNRQYRALVTDAKDKVTTFRLPPVHERGYAMHLADTGAKGMSVTVRAPAGTTEPYAPLYLVVHTRQVTKVAQVRPLEGGRAIFLVDENQLGEGISHFTIFDGNKRPVCERLYFKRPTANLLIEARSDKGQYATREKVRLDFLTHDSAGQPVAADLSVSVYQLDSLASGEPTEVGSYLWLASDLRGVESPAHYLNNRGAEADEALDNLMLTHGWRRFRWETVLGGAPAFTFIPEYGGHLLRGQVTHAQSGAPARGILAYLSAPGRYPRLYGSRSDEAGQVQFETKDLYGSRDLVLQTNAQRDSAYRVQLDSPYAEAVSSVRLPELDLARSRQNPLRLRSIQAQTQAVYFPPSADRYAAPETDSSAFYGVPDETYLLADYTRFTVMEEVMREYVPGVQVRKRKGDFYFQALNRPRRLFFEGEPLILLDGVPVFRTSAIMAFDPLKIKKLEVVTRSYVLGPLVFDGIVSYATSNGDLAGFGLDPRSLILEYEGLQRQREFYAPRYDTPGQTASRLPDFRSLLHWSPKVVTGGGGKNGLDFYASDQPGVYSVVVQGVSGSGLAGSQTFQFEVQAPR
ncbi:MAG: hypothetical protein H7Z75_03490 [Ferruginibacter sp.]|nr:hypothetical protein [Cytophagales bacterium]